MTVAKIATHRDKGVDGSKETWTDRQRDKIKSEREGYKDNLSYINISDRNAKAYRSTQKGNQ